MLRAKIFIGHYYTCYIEEINLLAGPCDEPDIFIFFEMWKIIHLSPLIKRKKFMYFVIYIFNFYISLSFYYFCIFQLGSY